MEVFPWHVEVVVVGNSLPYAFGCHHIEGAIAVKPKRCAVIMFTADSEFTAIPFVNLGQVRLVAVIID